MNGPIYLVSGEIRTAERIGADVINFIYAHGLCDWDDAEGVVWQVNSAEQLGEEIFRLLGIYVTAAKGDGRLL